jgi:hypothetical protein
MKKGILYGLAAVAVGVVVYAVGGKKIKPAISSLSKKIIK